MNCNENGVGFTKAELSALLAFTSKDEDRPHLCAVQVRVSDGRVWAYATDGHCAAEVDGMNEGEHIDGEWIVNKEFLAQGRQLITGKQVLRLAFSAASLNHARVEDMETGTEVSNLGWPHDAAYSQLTFPPVRDLLKLPPKERTVRCITLNPEFLALVDKVGKAASGGADIYPPKDPLQPVVIRVGAECATTWTLLIMPMRSETSEKANEGAA